MSLDSDPLEGSRAKDDTLDSLHASLPDEVDRRQYLKGAVVTIVGGSLAGCVGGNRNGGDDDNGNGGDDDNGNGGGGGGDDYDIGYPDGENVVYRNSYIDEPYEVQQWAALHEGFYADAGLQVPEVQTGDGSADTLMRVGQNEAQFGVGSFLPALEAINDDMDVQVLTGNKYVRNTMCLIYRRDMIEDAEPSSIQGSSILTASAFDQNTLEIFLETKDLTLDDVTQQVTEDATQHALMAQGEAAAMWGQIPNYPQARGAVDDSIELGVETMYSQSPVYGYPLVTNSAFLERENAEEYAVAVMEALSATMKWVMLNPEAAADMMVEEVNPNLGTRSTESIAETIVASINAPGLTEEATSEGLGAYTLDKVESTFEFGASAQDLDVPSVDEYWRQDLQDQAELTTLSDSEFDEAYELGRPFTEWY